MNKKVVYQFLKYGFKKSILIISLLIPFLLFEQFLKFNNFSKSGQNRYISMKEFAPNTYKLIKTNTEFYGLVEPTTALVRTDENGFILPKGNEGITNKKNKKIIFLGGSTTEAYRVNEQNRFPYLVAKKLNEKYFDKNVSFESLNSGLSGIHSMHSNLNLLTKGIEESPEIAVMMHNINDIAILIHEKSYFNDNSTRSLIDNLGYYDVAEKIGKDFLPYFTEAFLNPIWRIYFSFRSKNDEFSQSRKNLDESKKYFDTTYIKQEFKKSIYTFISLCKYWEIEPVLMTQMSRFKAPENVMPEIAKEIDSLLPQLKYAEFKNLHDQINNLITEIGVKEDILVIDLASSIPKESKYIYDHLHLSDEGSKLAANIIFSALSNNSKIKNLFGVD